MRARDPIPDGFGGGIGLRPDDLLPDHPTVGTEGESQHPWDAENLLASTATGSLGEPGVADVEPAGAVGSEDTTDLAHDGDQGQGDQGGARAQISVQVSVLQDGSLTVVHDLYAVLEDEVLPMWTGDREAWDDVMRHAMVASAGFTGHRMIQDYMHFYGQFRG